MTVVDFSSFEKLVNSECVNTFGLSLQDLPDVLYLLDYYEENLSIKEAKLRASEFVKDLQPFLL